MHWLRIGHECLSQNADEMFVAMEPPKEPSRSELGRRAPHHPLTRPAPSFTKIP